MHIITEEHTISDIARLAIAEGWVEDLVYMFRETDGTLASDEIAPVALSEREKWFYDEGVNAGEHDVDDYVEHLTSIQDEAPPPGGQDEALLSMVSEASQNWEAGFNRVESENKLLKAEMDVMAERLEYMQRHMIHQFKMHTIEWFKDGKYIRDTGNEYKRGAK